MEENWPDTSGLIHEKGMVLGNICPDNVKWLHYFYLFGHRCFKEAVLIEDIVVFSPFPKINNNKKTESKAFLNIYKKSKKTGQQCMEI